MSDLTKNVVMKPTTSNIAKSKFTNTPDHLTTFNGGYLIPVMIMPTLPNSEYNVNLASIINMPTLISEFYGKAFVDCYVFFATEKMLWEKYENFIGEGKDNTFVEKIYGVSGRTPNTDSVGAVITPTLNKPYVSFINAPAGYKISEHSLFNYLGVPVGVAPANLDNHLDAMPYRMYNLIYNNYFRSPFLQDPLYTGYGLDVDEYQNFELKKACKIPDYFTGYITTSPQLFADIGVALVGEVPVEADSPFADVSGDVSIIRDPDSPNLKLTWTQSPGSNEYVTLYNDQTLLPDSDSSPVHMVADPSVSGLDVPSLSKFSYFGGLKGSISNGKADIGGINPYVDLSNASGITLQALRNSFALQHISEKSLQGTDLKNLMRWEFGEDLSDLDLDKPIYCGGARIPLSVNSISQTSATLDVEENEEITTPLGYKAGQSKTTGVLAENVRVVSKLHGWIMVLICVRQESVYEYGINRNLMKKDRFDYYWRDFNGAVVSQPVANYEIYVGDNTQINFETFGFVPYAEHLRRSFNRISGYFSSKSAKTLNTYHLGSIFPEMPTLSDEFIESDADDVFDRLIAVESEKAHQFEGYFYFKIDNIIPVPVNNPIGLSEL